MRIFYCPECGKEEIKDEYLPRNNITYQNIRDGYGRPITHYKCECGNLLAGSIIVDGYLEDLGLIEYSKSVIAGYNKGGDYYSNGFYEYVEENYLRKRR